MKKKLLLIDGNSIFYKCFYATSFRLNLGKERLEDGTPINALRLFSIILIKLKKKYKDHGILVAFDAKGVKNYRHEFDFYKSNRKKQPEDLHSQKILVKEFLDILGVFWMEDTRFEADDLIGIVSEKLKKIEDIQIEIITSDKDLLQLVDKNVSVFISKKGISEMEEYNNLNFNEKYYDLSPLQVTDLKAMAGDSSDNLSGVPGIGEKGAVNLLLEFNNIDLIYQNINELKEKIKSLLIENKTKVYEFKKIATIIRESDLEINLEKFNLKKMENLKMKEFLTKYKLFNVGKLLESMNYN